MKRCVFLVLTLAVVAGVLALVLAACRDLAETADDGPPVVTSDSTLAVSLTTETVSPPTSAPGTSVEAEPSDPADPDTPSPVEEETTSSTESGTIRIDPHLPDLPAEFLLPALWTRYEETDSRLTWEGAWTTWALPEFSGGTARYSVHPSVARVALKFTGTSIRLIGARYNAGGTGLVAIDGGTAASVSYMLEGSHYQQIVWSSGALPSGVHVLTVTVYGGEINLDAVDVIGRLE